MSYTVSEISARSPDMDAREFAEFVKDIERNGQLVPIWVRGDEVIDGRKRLAACQQLGVEPRVVNLDPTQDAEQVARALNILRTHYATGQRAMFAHERANATKKDGRSISEFRDAGVVTVEQAAREAGVNPSAVHEARRVARTGSPAVADAVKAGTLSLHAASQIVQVIPKQEQPTAVMKIVAASKGKSRHTPVAKVLAGIDSRRDRAQPNPRHEQFALAVQKLEVGAELITTNLDAASGDIRRKEFLETLRHVRTTISRAITQLEAAA